VSNFKAVLLVLGGFIGLAVGAALGIALSYESAPVFDPSTAIFITIMLGGFGVPLGMAFMFGIQRFFQFLAWKLEPSLADETDKMLREEARRQGTHR
jgi:uncharacterized protein YacL